MNKFIQVKDAVIQTDFIICASWQFEDQYKEFVIEVILDGRDSPSQLTYTPQEQMQWKDDVENLKAVLLEK